MASQYTLAAANGIALTSGVDTNILQQLLQPGTYLVWGQVDYALGVSTVTELETGLSLVSATMPTQAGGGGMGPDPVVTTPVVFSLLSGVMGQQCGPTILTLTAPATLYLIAEATFSVGTVTASGTLSALWLIGAGHNMIVQ